LDPLWSGPQPNAAPTSIRFVHTIPSCAQKSNRFFPHIAIPTHFWRVSGRTYQRRAETQTQVIGPYRLLKELGVGGMGHVWLAEQTEPIRRQVALKLIRAGMYDCATVRRFKAERQSLAIMDHPTIAKVFDAGTMPAGQPYLVMEYVDGAPITDYCDSLRMSIRDRLNLFIRVCEGVQHAHQKAVIHRDLKPSNILVVKVDGKPMPRIIDCPEQADPNARDVDTAQTCIRSA